MRTQLFGKTGTVTQPSVRRHDLGTAEYQEFMPPKTLEEIEGRVPKGTLTENPFKGGRQMPFGGSQQQNKGFMAKGKKSKGFGNMKF